MEYANGAADEIKADENEALFQDIDEADHEAIYQTLSGTLRRMQALQVDPLKVEAYQPATPSYMPTPEEATVSLRSNCMRNSVMKVSDIKRIVCTGGLATWALLWWRSVVPPFANSRTGRLDPGWSLDQLVSSWLGTGRAGVGDNPTSLCVTFADVAGVSAAVEELREAVACLRNAEQYSRLGAKTPSGVLLYGPPGTGKTLLAKAAAGEAGVPFLAVSASEFVEVYVGRGAARVHELFAKARKASPCVLFIDELDALGGKRGMGFNNERDQTLNQLLTELDGFNGRPGVLLLAATNRVDMLDPALLRPGRISRRVKVPLPDKAGRAAILGVHLRGVVLAPGEASKADVARQLAAATPGFPGAELANVVNEALLLVGRRHGNVVSMAELQQGTWRTRDGVNGGSSAWQVADLARWLGRWLSS